MALLGVLLTWSLDQQATAMAIVEATHDTREVARAVVEPDLPSGLSTGDPGAIATMDQVVRQRVLSDRVVRVKIWAPTGTILYSDERRLIGSTFQLDPDELDLLSTGGVIADLSDLTEPENRYETAYGQLLQVYVRIQSPDVGPLLFENYIRYDALIERSRRLLLNLLPSMLACLVLLELALLPLAWQLARRVREGQRERQRLLERAVEASEAERRRIAADLHDSTVQDLAAMSYSLAGMGRQLASAGHAAAAEAVEEAARTTRHGLRQLRTLLVDIYPPNLHREGLEAALRALLESAREQGLQAELTIPPSLPMNPDTERLVYRAAQEAVRNVVAHAEASRVEVSVHVDRSRAVLTVRDDGRGFNQRRNGRHEPGEHLGLRLLSDLAREAGGQLDVSSEEGRGTTVHLQVPARGSGWSPL